MTVQEDRFTEQTMREIVNFITLSDALLPNYETDTRKRDKALQKLWRSESLMAGTLAAAVSRDKNRGWTLTGTARSVGKNARKLHNAHGGIGWRNFISMNSTQWYTSNFGYLSEVVYEDGKPSGVYNIDSSNTRRTPNPELVEYYPHRSGVKKLTTDKLILANSMPNTEERMNYAGFCSLERALLFVRLMIGLHSHQLEKLGVAPPKGILFGSGIRRTEWVSAVESYYQEKLNADTSTYNGVMGLFAEDPGAAIRLIGLSELPENFNLRDWIDNIMKAYSLAFGVPVYTFWTPESGTFGRGKEVSEMRKASTYMGELEFALSFQEQIQKKLLPPQVTFDFNMRDDDAEITKLEVNDKVIAQVKALLDMGVITVENAAELLVEKGVLPKKMYGGEVDNETYTDLQELRERALSNIETRVSYSFTPSEPYVVYEYSPQKEYRKAFNFDSEVSLESFEEFPSGNVTVLFKNFDDYSRRRVF